MSKKIGVISDTHGLLRLNVMEILQTCDCIIHAGDFDREEILEAIDKAKVRLNANVNFDLTMELLFLTVRENLK